MEAVGTDMLQVWRGQPFTSVFTAANKVSCTKVGSTNSRSESRNVSSSHEVLAADLRELARLLEPHQFRLTDEILCGATYAPVWKQVWEIVQKVDRTDVGLCLDTFQTTGGEQADLTIKSGLIEDEGREALEPRFSSSLVELRMTIPAEKIYILQISGTYKPETPLDATPDSNGLRRRGKWCPSFRPLPFDGGYLPVVQVAQSVLQTGFCRWFSTEIVDGRLQGNGRD